MLADSFSNVGIWSSADEKQPHLWVRIEFHSSLLTLDILHKTQARLPQIKKSLFLAERHIYLYLESSSLLGTKWSFIHCYTLILTYFLVFPSQNKDPPCSSVPEFKHDQTQSVSATLGHSVVLTCTASIGLNHTDSHCKDHMEWIKDGTPLTNLTYSENVKDWWVYDAIQWQILNIGSVYVSYMSIIYVYVYKNIVETHERDLVTLVWN